MKSTEIKVTIIEASEVDNYDEDEGFSFRHPAKYYFVNAMGQYIYVHTRDMKVVTDYIKEHYDGKYAVRTAKQSNGSGSYTCVGTATRARPSSRPPK
jgi:hypothetical protein